MLPFWIRFGAPLILGFWFITGTTFSLLRYGASSGMYLWFCNLALAGVALGIATRNRSVLLAFVAGASFTQTAWLADNVWRILFAENLFGLVEFLYHPGMSTAEYVLSSYHFFVLPCALLALYYLPREERNWSPWIVLTFGILLFTLSYYPFTADHNVNCARESCFDFINRWDNTWQYTLVFATLTIAIALTLTHAWDRLFKAIPRNPKTEKIALTTFGILVGLGVVLATMGTRYQASLPKFTCAKPFEDSQVAIRCGYTLEYDDGVFLMEYFLKNKKDTTVACNTKIALFGDFQLMHQDVYVKANQEIPVAVLLPYPPQDVKARLTAACGESDSF